MKGKSPSMKGVKENSMKGKEVPEVDTADKPDLARGDQKQLSIKNVTIVI